MNYLDRLKAKNPENKPSGYCKNCNKPLNNPFCSYCSSQGVHFSKNEPIPETTNRLTAWLAHIGESNPELITDFWQQCRTDPGALAYFLRRAKEAANDPRTSHPIQANDTRRFCRQCLNHRPVKGRPPAKIRCEARDRLWLDDIPRHCDDFMDNGELPPVIGVSWTPEPINRHSATKVNQLIPPAVQATRDW